LGKIVDISRVKMRRNMIQANHACEAKLPGPVSEMSGCDVIAETILRPRYLDGFGNDVDIGFEHGLVPVVARTQHHSVFSERDWLSISVASDMPDRENWHFGPTLIRVAASCIISASLNHWLCFNQAVAAHTNVADGSFATEPSRVRVIYCPLCTQ
jgi:hypothetical protein